MKGNNSKSIVDNIIMISPTRNVHKRLTKLAKDRDKNISELCEEIVEEYVNNQSI